jgi:chromosome segregation ATPase
MPDISSRYDDERQRSQSQSQILHLQNQIDELRRQLKDTNNKYTWAMEQMRKSESLVGQIQGIVDKSTQENLHTLEGYRRELTALRKEIAGALLKIEEQNKPIRDLQTQVQQLNENRKRDQLVSNGMVERLDVLETRTQDYDARLREGDERDHQLVIQLDKLREVDQQTALEIRRVYEELQIEKQGLRRQAVEAQQMVADLQGTLQEMVSQISRNAELLRALQDRVEAFPEQIDLLQQQVPEIIVELKRIERTSTDHFLLNQERLEEVRGLHDTKIDDLRGMESEHVHQLQSWLERIDSWCREHEAKLTRAQNRVETIRQEHMSRIQDTEVRERRLIDSLLSALRQIDEQTRAERVAIDSEL